MNTLIRSWFTPNHVLSATSTRFMITLQVVIFLILWVFADFPFLPSPTEIGLAWMKLLSEGMSADLASSILLSFQATAITIVLSLLIAYASVMPFFRPFAALVSQFRFNGIVGLTLFFTAMTSTTHSMKISLLVFTMVVWFVTSLRSVMGSIPEAEKEHARTLRMKEWQVVWEVQIVGKLDRVFEVIRQNTAISWIMLTTVEGFAKTEGGVGALLINNAKYLKISEVLAIQITILVVGITLNWAWGAARKMFFPYADLSTERK